MIPGHYFGLIGQKHAFFPDTVDMALLIRKIERMLLIFPLHLPMDSQTESVGISFLCPTLLTC